MRQKSRKGEGGEKEAEAGGQGKGQKYLLKTKMDTEKMPQIDAGKGRKASAWLLGLPVYLLNERYLTHAGEIEGALRGGELFPRRLLNSNFVDHGGKLVSVRKYERKVQKNEHDHGDKQDNNSVGGVG